MKAIIMIFARRSARLCASELFFDCNQDSELFSRIKNLELTNHRLRTKTKDMGGSVIHSSTTNPQRLISDSSQNKKSFKFFKTFGKNHCIITYSITLHIYIYCIYIQSPNIYIYITLKIIYNLNDFDLYWGGTTPSRQPKKCQLQSNKPRHQ